jgi:geranylgeranylglycerol-phosphate geranylgeranyltransferase
MNIRGFYLITRPVNSIVSGLAAAIGYLIATGTLHLEVILPIAIVAFITAGGNVINDYFDAGIDAINRPGRPDRKSVV